MLKRYGCIEGDEYNYRLASPLHDNLVDTNAYDAKILHNRKQLLAMVNNVRDEKCRRNTIQEYFGFPGPGECGNCDHCSTHFPIFKPDVFYS